MFQPRVALVVALVLALAGVGLFLHKAREERAHLAAQAAAAAARAAKAAMVSTSAPVAVATATNIAGATADLTATNAPRYVRADLPFEQQVRDMFNGLRSYWKVDVDAQEGVCTIRSYLEIAPNEADELTRKIAVKYSRFRHLGPVKVRFYGPQPESNWLLLAQADANNGKVVTAHYLGGE